MAGDQITAYVLFNLHGKDLSLTLEGRLSVQDGYLRLAATRLMLGSLPIPQATVDRAVAPCSTLRRTGSGSVCRRTSAV